MSEPNEQQPTFQQELKAEEQLHRLRAENRSLLRKLADTKARTEELVQAVRDAAREAADALDLPPVEPPAAPRKGSGTPETAIAVLSDWQLSKRTQTYNSDVCEQRIQLYAKRVERLADLQRADHPVNDLRVYLVGDLIEGELIFPGQAHLIDSSLYSQVLVNGPRILGNFIRRMLTVFERVHVEGVIGNHGSLGGRARRDYHPETNADAMMYEATRMVLQHEQRLTWSPNMVPGERKWYAVDYIGRKGFMIFHGDQVKGGFAGYPWYGFGKKIMGWRMGAIPETFHYAISGHFHTPIRGLYGGIRHWGSGSTESSNAYAAENLAAQGTPSQWLLFSHPEHGITAEYEVHLGGDRK